MSRPRLLELCESTRSGVGVSFSTYIAAAREMGFEVEVACSVLRDGRFQQVVDQLRADDVPVHVLPITRAVRPGGDRRMYQALTRLLTERSFQMVHTHGSKAGVLGRLARHTIHCPSWECQAPPS